jgi:hypothetical protein
VQHGLYDIYCSAHNNRWSSIIRSFWLLGVVGADLRPDNYFDICIFYDTSLLDCAQIIVFSYLEYLIASLHNVAKLSSIAT